MHLGRIGVLAIQTDGQVYSIYCVSKLKSIF